MKRNLIVRVRLSEGERRALEQLARQNQQTLSDYIRESVNSTAAESSDAPPPLRLGK